MTPLVSVIMPVYNAGNYLNESIDSILNQTYANFEFIIVNDGSTDISRKIISNYKDYRILFLENNKNRGLAFCLNKGINSSKGKYIIRMDADDISFSNRIKEQVSFMESNQDVGISGTWMKSFGSSKYLYKYPVDSEKCKTQLLFDVPLGHPSVIFRKKLVTNFNLYYNEKLLTYGEDYDLWVRFSEFTKISNIPKVLIKYRVVSNNFKLEEIRKRQLQANLIRKQQLVRWIKDYGKIKLSTHIVLSSPLLISNNNINVSINDIKEWANYLLAYNQVNKKYNPTVLHKILVNNFFLVCYHKSTIYSFLAFFKSQFFSINVSFLLTVKFLLKIIFRNIK